MEKIDPSVDALKHLCQKVGGYKMLALEIGVNDQTIYQIVSGVKLPSGNPKGVGPTLRRKIEAHYPDWLAGGKGDTPQGNSAPDSDATAAPAASGAVTLEQALQVIQQQMQALSPILHDAGKACLERWLRSEASLRETEITLRALIQASKSLPSTPAVVETPIVAKNPP